MIQIVDTVWIRHIVDQHGTVRPSIKGHTEGLKAFLPCRVPYLQRDQMPLSEGVRDDRLFGQKIGSDGGLVLAGEFSRRIAVHEGGLADTVDE